MLGHLQGVLDGAGWNGAPLGLLEQGIGHLTGSESPAASPSGIVVPFQALILVQCLDIWSRHMFGALAKCIKKQILKAIRK